ncbi:MAG: hypothetical protein J2P37_06610 [Ktedonobacteraceae bacterium]|nr:hypothetical protein [Ktedonobacteraceae bacterium]MBO0794178.1 hypothetical protein [Ktedonobacteraceae bacterium]
MDNYSPVNSKPTSRLHWTAVVSGTFSPLTLFFVFTSYVLNVVLGMESFEWSFWLLLLSPFELLFGGIALRISRRSAWRQGLALAILGLICSCLLTALLGLLGLIALYLQCCFHLAPW